MLKVLLSRQGEMIVMVRRRMRTVEMMLLMLMRMRMRKLGRWRIGSPCTAPPVARPERSPHEQPIGTALYEW